MSDRRVSWIDRINGLIELFENTMTGFVSEVGSMVVFATDALRLSFKPPLRYLEVIKHFEFVGNGSVMIICLTGAFTGLAVSYQIYLGFKMVNAVNLVGPTVALGITRELGPVLTGLIVAARAGGAMAARLGTMRVNEQIDALDVMGVNTKQYLIAPRIYAAVAAMPLLTAIFDAMAMLGAWFLCVKLVELDPAVFWDKVQNTLKVRHLFEGFFKSTVFGAFFAAICTYRGFHTSGGAKGVGEATNRGVVQSMVMIIVLDYFLTNMIRIFYLAIGATP
ncbi:MAG: organic solvent ABC transporter permease [Bdellovibrio sp.]|nr:MAG: organic solvent ABC transporter permease [Bdellovibrio sp.]